MIRAMAGSLPFSSGGKLPAGTQVVFAEIALGKGIKKFLPVFVVILNNRGNTIVDYHLSGLEVVKSEYKQFCAASSEFVFECSFTDRIKRTHLLTFTAPRC
jgi:hypothetical protein